MKPIKQRKKLERQVFRNILPPGYFRFVRWLWTYVGDYFFFLGYSVLFTRAGKCKRCGRCCRHVYLRERGKLVSSFHDCLELIKSDQQLKQFTAKGKNAQGELFFACNHITRDNSCAIYKKRPLLCRTYPDVSMLRYGAIPKDNCGFYFINRFTRRRVT